MISISTGSDNVYKKPGLFQPAYSVNAVTASSNMTAQTGHKFIFDIYVSTNFGSSYTKVASLKSLPSINNYSTVEFSDVVKNYVESIYIHENPNSIIRYKELAEDSSLGELSRYSNLVRIKILAGEEYKTAGVLNTYDGYGNIGSPAFPVVDFYTTYQALSSNNKDTFKIKTALDRQQINALHFDYLPFIHKAVQNQSKWLQDPELAPGYYKLSETTVWSQSRLNYVGDKTFTNYGVRYLSNQPTERTFQPEQPNSITYLEGANIYIPYSYDDSLYVDLNESYVGRGYDEVSEEDYRYWHFYNNFRNRQHTIGYEFFDVGGRSLGEIKYQPDSTIFGNPMKTGLMNNVNFPVTNGVTDPLEVSKWREVEYAAYPEISDYDRYNLNPYDPSRTLMSSYTGYGLFNQGEDYLDSLQRHIYDRTDIVSGNTGVSSAISEMRGDCLFTSDERADYSFIATTVNIAQLDYPGQVFPFRGKGFEYRTTFPYKTLSIGSNTTYAYNQGTFIAGSGVNTNLWSVYVGNRAFIRLRMTIPYLAGLQCRVRVKYWSQGTYDWHYDSGSLQSMNNLIADIPITAPQVSTSNTYDENMRAVSEHMLGSFGNVEDGRHDRVIVEVYGDTYPGYDRNYNIECSEVTQTPWLNITDYPELYRFKESSIIQFNTLPSVVEQAPSWFSDESIFRFQNGRTDSETLTFKMKIKQIAGDGSIGYNRNILDRDSNNQPLISGSNWYVPFTEFLPEGIQISKFTSVIGIDGINDYNFSAALALSMTSSQYSDTYHLGSPQLAGALGKSVPLNEVYVADNGRPPLEILEAKTLPYGIENDYQEIYLTFRMNYGGTTPDWWRVSPSIFMGMIPDNDDFELKDINLIRGTNNQDMTRLYGATDYRINIYDTDAPINIIKSTIGDAGTFQANISNIAAGPGVTISKQDVRNTSAQTWWNDDVDGFYDDATGLQYGTPRQVLKAQTSTISGNQIIVNALELAQPDDTALYHTWVSNKQSNLYESGYYLYDNLTKIRMVMDCMVYVEDNGVDTVNELSNLYIHQGSWYLNGESGATVLPTSITSKNYTATDRGSWKRIYVTMEYDQADMAQLVGLKGSNNDHLDFYLNFTNGGASGNNAAWSNAEVLVSDLRVYFVPEDVTDMEDYIAKHYANSQLKVNVGQEPFYKQFNDLKMNDAYSLFWLNPYGTWDNYRFKGKSQKTVDVNRSQRGVGLDKTGDLTGYYSTVKQSYGDNIDFNINATEVYELRSDYLKDNEREWLEELLISPKVFLYDEESKWFIRVNGLTGNYTNVIQKNQKLFQLALEVQVSQERRTQQVLGLK